MHALLRSLRSGLLASALVAIAVCAATPSFAAVLMYSASFSGAIEVPPNASPGSGTVDVNFDTDAHTMSINATFTGLLGNTSAAHIHAPTLVAGTGTAGVATQTPSFAGFPLGVTAGVFVNTYDLTLASSWNATYITNNGGTPASAETAFLAAVAAGKAYFNIHSSSFPGGEIRGFLVPASTPVMPSTWGKIKGTYR